MKRTSDKLRTGEAQMYEKISKGCTTVFTIWLA